MKKILLIAIIIALFILGYSVSVTPSYNTLNISAALEKARLELKGNQEIVVFGSKNPFNFYDVFHRMENIADQQVYGILTKPDTVGIFPVIIGVAGSAGWGEHHYGYLERYLEMGFAVFSLHSFKSRNVESTVGEQLTVTMPMMVHDAFMALRRISEDDNIDVTRAGLTGWSLGGGVALFSAWSPIQELISPDIKFAAHLPFYPPCMIIPEELRFNDVPIHILTGELDDWVPAAACEELIEMASNVGCKIDITVYPGASHSFDRTMDVILDKNAYSFTNCRMKLDNSGVARLMNGFPLSSPALQKIGLSFCAEKGAHWGGNKYARENSMEFAKTFMLNNLKK
jgi:dienelactone hydrolase